jgi:hypothetical protein
VSLLVSPIWYARKIIVVLLEKIRATFVDCIPAEVVKDAKLPTISARPVSSVVQTVAN